MVQFGAMQQERVPPSGVASNSLAGKHMFKNLPNNYI
jgi:hypothetical protein